MVQCVPEYPDGLSTDVPVLAQADKQYTVSLVLAH